VKFRQSGKSFGTVLGKKDTVGGFAEKEVFEPGMKE